MFGGECNMKVLFVKKKYIYPLIMKKHSLILFIFTCCGKLLAMETTPIIDGVNSTSINDIKPIPIDNMIEGKNEKSLVSPCTCAPQKKENEKIDQASIVKYNIEKKVSPGFRLHSFIGKKDVRKILVLHSSNCTINDFLMSCFDRFVDISCLYENCVSTSFMATIGDCLYELIFVPYEYYSFCGSLGEEVDLVINLWKVVEKFSFSNKNSFYGNCRYADFLYKFFVEESKKCMFFCGFGDPSLASDGNFVCPAWEYFSFIEEKNKNYLWSFPIYNENLKSDVFRLCFKKALENPY